MTNKQLHKLAIEQLADVEHEQWAHWMDYLFSKCGKTEEGDFVIRLEDVNRWKRQMNTPYHLLTEEEKNSDREWAEKAWNAIVKSQPSPNIGFSAKIK